MDTPVNLLVTPLRRGVEEEGEEEGQEEEVKKEELELGCLGELRDRSRGSQSVILRLRQDQPIISYLHRRTWMFCNKHFYLVEIIMCKSSQSGSLAGVVGVSSTLSTDD